MKQLTHILAIAIMAFTLTACGDASTDEPLPEGAAPSDPPAEREAAVSIEPLTEHPDLAPEPETASPPPLPLPIPEGDTERTAAPGISYVLPKDWTVGPPKQMRLLTLLPPNAGDAELAISKWPRDVGGFALNVQRWVKQAGLPPIEGLTTAAESDFEKFNVDGTTATWIPLMNEGTNDAILVVWAPIGENPDQPTETWTFKLKCDADQVESLAPAFRAWCESVRFE